MEERRRAKRKGQIYKEREQRMHEKVRQAQTVEESVATELFATDPGPSTVTGTRLYFLKPNRRKATVL